MKRKNLFLPPFMGRIADPTNPSVRKRIMNFCSFCRCFRPASKHDPCIRNMSCADFACCGHGAKGQLSAWRNRKVHNYPSGYAYAVGPGITFRFFGNIHPNIVRAAMHRLIRGGATPAWAVTDAEAIKLTPGRVYFRVRMMASSSIRKYKSVSAVRDRTAINSKGHGRP